MFRASRLDHKGAFRDRQRTLGAGCGGRDDVVKTSGICADGEIVWF
jgi:hypothetical protein